MCVSEGVGGREGGRGGGGPDTELKTKTPHVNVGNKIICVIYGIMVPNFFGPFM